MVIPNDNGNESTAYGGGGAGGKFRKTDLRKTYRRTTPYDRPLTVQKGNKNPGSFSENNGGLFTKFVLDPASRLISYGAHRFFASVFRKRLPPPPLQESGVKGDLSNVLEVPVPNIGGKVLIGDASTQPLHRVPCDGISEFEELLKQKNFNRSEINHLIELLNSRAAGELSPVLDHPPGNEETVTDIGRSHPFSNSFLGREIKDGDLDHGVKPTPISANTVIENDTDSPTELAKAYMGARPSKISSMHNQLGREDLGLLGRTPLSSKFPIFPPTGKTSVTPISTEDGNLTPKSRGRSAIYNMARTPYSRFHLLQDNKGSILMNNGYGRPSVPSSSHSRVEHIEKSDAKPMTLKRRSSVLDDDIGSAGPVRKIRQKQNLLVSRTLDSLRSVDSISDHASSPIYPAIVGPNKRVLRISEKNENDSFQNESYTHVPSKSSQVAAKILEHLENLSPKEKSFESKSVNAGQKSPSRLTHSMLKGKALRSIEDVGSSKLFLSVVDDPKVEDRPASTLFPTQDSIIEQQEKLKENTLKESSSISNALNPVMKNESVLSLKGHTPSNETCGAPVVIGSTQLPETKKAFRMSAQEDLFDLDDEYLSEPPLMEGEEQAGAILVGDMLSVPPKIVLPEGSLKEVTAATVVIDKDNGKLPPYPEKGNTGIQLEASLPAALSAKEERTNNSSIKKVESSLEKSTSVVDVLPPAGSHLEIVSEPGRPLIPLETGDANGKSHEFSAVSLDAPHLSKPAVISFTTSCNETQASTASSGFLTSSNVSIFGSLSTSAAGSTSTSLAGFGSSSISAPIASAFGGPFLKFGPSVEQSTTTSTTSALVPGITELNADAVKETKFGSSNGTYSIAANPGSSPSGGDASVSFPPVDINTGSSMKSTGTGSHSSQFGSSVAFPSLITSNATSLSTSSSNALPDSSVSASSQFNTGTSGFSFTGSHGNPIGSSSGTAPAIFSFGSVSTASTTTTTPNNVNTPPVFAFGVNSAASSVTDTSGSLGSGSSGIFKFGASPSVPSSSITSLSSNGTTASLFSFSSPSPSTAFSFGAFPSTSATNSTSKAFNSSISPASTPIFSFTAASSPSLSPTPAAINQPIFGNKFSSFTSSPGNVDQLNAEDSMAEDPVQSFAPSIPVFGQPSVSPSPPGFVFGSTVPAPANPFQFNSQQNQIAHQNPSPFQASGSLEFNAGGSFSLGSSGTDKSNRKFVKVSRNKNRKK